MPASTTDTPIKLSVTSLSQYVRLENCDRFLRLSLRPDEQRQFLRKWGLTIQPLTPLLRDAGLEFERDVTQILPLPGDQVLDLQETDATGTVSILKEISQPSLLLQVSLEAPIGRVSCRGRADVIRAEPARGGLKLMIADIKASQHERMEHQLQVATYAFMLKRLASEHGIRISEMQGTILTRREDGSIPSFQDCTPFELDTYLSILQQLIEVPDSVVNRISDAPFEGVSYHLGYRCDGCLFNAICMYDSAERMDLSLVPKITASEKRVLQSAGVTDLQGLAELMELPSRGSGQRELTVNATQRALVDDLKNRWPVGPNLPILVQRARRALRRFDPSATSSTFLYGSGFGTLPSETDHPSLVKIYLDAQHDYLADRIYMLAALVKGLHGAETVVFSTEGPPSDESERLLLIQWVINVIAALERVADAPSAPVHLYCYNRYDQKMLLEALKRHLEQVAAFPAFFDLMTQSAALSQPIISFLSEEVSERRNLGLICAPLHDVARVLGFNWSDGEYDYYRLFRARLFDNRRDVIRLPNGTLKHANSSIPKEAPNRLTIESASRFNSQIPLEYAYAAWGQLPAEVAEAELLKPFREIDLIQLRAFAGHRAKALAHIEESFKQKARFLNKPPVNLPALTAALTDEIPLSRSLQEFLYMEHYASFQGKLLQYSLPIERRAQTGLALLLKYEGVQLGPNQYRFLIDFTSMGLEPELTMNAFRLNEGAWVVINNAAEQRSANAIKNGRLALIQALGQDWMELELLSALSAIRTSATFILMI